MAKKSKKPVTLAPGERIGRDGRPYNYLAWIEKKKREGTYLPFDQWLEKKKQEEAKSSTPFKKGVEEIEDSDDEPVFTPKKQIQVKKRAGKRVSPTKDDKRKKEERKEKLVSLEKNVLDLVKTTNSSPCTSLIQRLIILDTETTGLGENDEISLIETVEGIKTGRYLHFFINPKGRLPKKSIAIHNLTKQKLKKFPHFEEVAYKILAFIGSSTILAHNAGFDRRMLNNGLKRTGIDPLPESRFIDTWGMAKFLFPGEKTNQNALCEKFGIDNFNRVTTGIHSAMEDTAQLYLIYRNLICLLKERGVEQSRFRL